MRIKLHVGHFKTGTTSFQSLLSSQRRRLLDGGVLYPLGNKPLFHQQGVGIVEFARDEPDRDITTLVDHWTRDTPGTLVLSAEGLSNPRTGGGKAVVEILKQYGEVHVIYMVRHWSTYLPSRFKQNTKTGDKWSWEKFIESCERTCLHNRDINFAAVASEYLTGAPEKFTLLGYNRDTAVSDLLSACGIEPSLQDLPRDEAAYFGDNPPHSEIAIEAMRLLNITSDPEGPVSLRFDTLLTNTRLPRRLGVKRIAKLYLEEPRNLKLISELVTNYPSVTPQARVSNIVQLLTTQLRMTCDRYGLDYPFESNQHIEQIPVSLGSKLDCHEIPSDVMATLKATLTSINSP